MSLNELLQFVSFGYKRELHKILYEFATRTPFPTTPDFSDPYERSRILSVYLAADLLVRAVNPVKDVGPAVETISFALDNYSDQNIRDLLATFRVTITRKASRERRAQEFIEPIWYQRRHARTLDSNSLPYPTNDFCCNAHSHCHCLSCRELFLLQSGIATIRRTRVTSFHRGD
jgi:hypothetical protein